MNEAGETSTALEFIVEGYGEHKVRYQFDNTEFMPVVCENSFGEIPEMVNSDLMPSADFGFAMM